MKAELQGRDGSGEVIESTGRQKEGWLEPEVGMVITERQLTIRLIRYTCKKSRAGQNRETAYSASSTTPLISSRDCTHLLFALGLHRTKQSIDHSRSLPIICNPTQGRLPEVKWAERVDKVYLTVLLPDAKNPKVNLDPDGKFTFSATAGTENHLYELKLDLHEKVNVEESKINLGLRNILCVIEKAEEGWWKKLLRGDGKAPHYVKVDWDKWADEDGDDAPADLDLEGMDFSGFGGGNMGEEELEDTDDEDEEVEKPTEQHAETAEGEPMDAKTEDALGT
ncbi:hypothetical protein IFM89_029362 [Coptis chinensis]|uniref:Co-chaperone protein p23 n=1 Tax=Coptis chinensis TaxID=261450 RepID=A0A835IUY7_9MAGN|nr:hypothetical protein IFM89_029362 [Coptis chinensis]